ncbi:MAG: acylphosphatase, partial [Nitrospirae bacterium]
MPKKRVHLFIEGRVQGVWYRAFTRDVALKNDLKGWVRNLPDGRVEAVFEGEEANIERAIAECYKGPPAAHVTKIDIKNQPYKG